MMAKIVAWYQQRQRGRLVLSPAPEAPPAELAYTQPGWAVRRDWPDGSHEFSRFRSSAEEAAKHADADRTYWQRGSIRPELSIVEISRHDFSIHHGRTSCTHPDCPQARVREVVAR